MAIKTRFVMPLLAFNKMRDLGYTGTVDSMFSQFCAEREITDNLLRLRAQKAGTTLTEVVRRTVVAELPEMFDSWPPNRVVPKPHQRIEEAVSDREQLRNTACKLITALLADPDDGRTKRRARDFLVKYRD